MALQPIYTSENVRPAYNLRFDWTGWLKPPIDRRQIEAALQSCRHLWHAEGIDLETFHLPGDSLQILMRTLPAVAPVFVAQRLKGRLQHACRELGGPVEFRRKVAIRSLGDNTRESVEGYVERQVLKSDYADPRFKQFLGHFVLADPAVHLEEASATMHGRYWYNLHLVMVVADRRCPVVRNENFVKLRQGCGAVASKKGYAISCLAVMPDHLHIALRGMVDHSPQDIALAFLNNLSYVMGYNRCWSWEYYVGTFSEYSAGLLMKQRQ